MQTNATPPNQPQVLPHASADGVRAAVFEGLASYPTVAEALGVSVRSVQNLVARREIEVVRICRAPFVVLASLREMVARQREQRHAPPRRGRPKRK